MSGGILFHLHKFARNFSYLAEPPLSELEIGLAYDYSMARLPTFPPSPQPTPVAWIPPGLLLTSAHRQ